MCSWKPVQKTGDKSSRQSLPTIIGGSTGSWNVMNIWTSRQPTSWLSQQRFTWFSWSLNKSLANHGPVGPEPPFPWRLAQGTDPGQGATEDFVPQDFWAGNMTFKHSKAWEYRIDLCIITVFITCSTRLFVALGADWAPNQSRCSKFAASLTISRFQLRTCQQFSRLKPT